MSLISILLVDDSPLFLKATRRFLTKNPCFEITGCARSGPEALAQANQTRPDLVLLDWVMPNMNGLEVTRRLKARPNAPRVIILTLHNHDEYRLAAQEAGADGFVIKSEAGTRLIPAIQHLFNGSR